MKSPYVLDVTSATFEREVLETSRQIPVLVDFWAPWCAPCRTLGPMLERLAVEYDGRFRLAKVNSDENPELSQVFGIRSIPDVRAFRDAEHVDQFVGVLPERELRAFIEKIAPAPAEAARVRAIGLRAARDTAGAEAALRQAVSLDASNELARIDLAELLLETGNPDEASQLLEGIRPNIDWDARVAAVKQGIGYARSRGNETDLRARVAADPSDVDSRLALAGALAGRKAWREAMEQLLEIVRRDKAWRDGEARKQMLAMFTLAAAHPDLVSEYRKKLASALN
ncbi:MAG: tetratricopeptide repeat protein [Rhodospirillaceae bacterium]